jgi:predicted DNA-binding transcriptional regulator YafY
VTGAPYRYQARVRVRAPAASVLALIPPQVGRVSPLPDGWCLLEFGGDNLDVLALHVAALGFEVQVLEPPELRDAAARLARRLGEMAKT